MVSHPMATITEQSKMTPPYHSSPTRLFPLTDKDLARMAHAIKLSKQFMKKYGQGRQPRQITSEHYINSCPGLFTRP